MATSAESYYPTTTNASEFAAEHVSAEKSISSSLLYQRIGYSLIATVGVIGNIFVIVVIVKTPALKKKLTNWFLANQSIIDTFASVFLVLHVFGYERSHVFTGSIGLVQCGFIASNYFLWSVLMSSTYNLVIINLERYFSVVHAILHKNYFRKKVAICLLSFTWLFGLAFNLFSPILAEVVNGRCRILRFRNKDGRFILGWVTFFAQFAIPLAIMAFCYIRMGIVLCTNKNANSAGSNKKLATNIIKTMAIVSATFVLCWSWNSVYFLLINVGYKLKLSGWFYYFSVTAVNMNCVLNPFIYTFKYRPFRIGVRMLFCKQTNTVVPFNTNTTPAGET